MPAETTPPSYYNGVATERPILWQLQQHPVLQRHRHQNIQQVRVKINLLSQARLEIRTPLSSNHKIHRIPSQ